MPVQSTCIGCGFTRHGVADLRFTESEYDLIYRQAQAYDATTHDLLLRGVTALPAVEDGEREAEEVRQQLIQLAALAGDPEEWHLDASHAGLIDYIRREVIILLEIAARALGPIPSASEAAPAGRAVVGPSVYDWLRNPAL